jgi:hypothetical protein
VSSGSGSTLLPSVEEEVELFPERLAQEVDNAREWLVGGGVYMIMAQCV